ncbi:hypothetical protein LEP3755_64480 (plasmid) [Leptolyngbya sp. NIES-3755]|nr:hypothetical protein LEP3755_64480 [Leptolyngbya sp. NIES-3755]
MTPKQQALIHKAQSRSRSKSNRARILRICSLPRLLRNVLHCRSTLRPRRTHTFSSHAAVISAFGQHLARPGKVPTELHRQLIDAQAQRTRADTIPLLAYLN